MMRNGRPVSGERSGTQSYRYDPLGDNHEDPLRGSHEDIDGSIKDDEHDSVKAAQEKKVWRYKCVKLAALTLCLSAQGLDDCLTSPSIPDMRERLGLSMEDYAKATIASSLGVMIGSLSGGLLSDRFPRFTDMVISLALALMSVCVVLRPWSPNLLFLCLNTMAGGFAGGAINAGTSAVHLGMWGAKPMPMYIKNFGWTLTCPMSPLLAKDFLSDVNHTFYDSNNSVSSHHYVTNNTLQWWEFEDGSLIQIPYAIVGFFALTLVPIFCVFQWKQPPAAFKSEHKKKSTWKEVFSPGSCAGGATCFSITMLISLTSYYFLIVGANQAVWDLMFSYVIDPRANLHFTKDQASYLQTGLTSIYLVCRILTIFISPRIPIQVLLGGSVFTSLACMFMLTFYGIHNVTMLWIFALLLNFVQSPAWAAGTLWAEHYIHVYAIMIGLTNLGSGLSAMCFSWINGRLFDSDRPENIFYLGFGCYCIYALHFIISQVNASCHVKKYGRKTYMYTMSSDVELDPADQEKLLSDDIEDTEEAIELEVVNGQVIQNGHG